MASWVVHLRVTDLLLDRVNADRTCFLVGNIAPDSGSMNADRLTYTPPATVSHFSLTENKKNIRPDVFRDEYITGETDEKSFPFTPGITATSGPIISGSMR